MTLRNKLILAFAFLLAAVWAGWNAYGYFFSYTNPVLHIEGIESEKCYAGDTECIVRTQDNYKVNTIKVWLDGKPLVENIKANRRRFDYPLTLTTDNLANGKHELEFEAENGTYQKARERKKIAFYVDNMPLHAAFINHFPDAKVFQGRTLRVQFQVNKEVANATAYAFSKSFDCCLESGRSLIYECFIPVDCEELPGDNQLTIEITDKVGNTVSLDSRFTVVQFPFKRQTLKINPEKIKEENEIGLSEKDFEHEMEELVSKSPEKKLWQGPFITPIELKDKSQITTDFGVIRTTQERGLRQHKALDVYTTPKSVVWATQDGIVVLKNRYAHSGNTVVLDHGCGIFTLYFHLDSFADINVGDKVKRGNSIGKLGKTGYATGYHLHWEMRIQNIAVDPLQWTKNNF